MSIVLNIRKDTSTEWLPTPVTTISKDDKILYYFVERPLDLTKPTEKQNDDLILLYDENKQPLWKLISKDWDGLSLADHHYGTSSSCYCQQQRVVKLKNNQLTILQEYDLMVSSFLCLSGLLVIKSPYPHMRSPTTITEEGEDDVTSLSQHYPGHHSLVETRWSSHSNKSLELDPGFWHCFWGYNFWWSWFPCCMPGGILDRAIIKLKGVKSKSTSKQGYVQHYY